MGRVVLYGYMMAVIDDSMMTSYITIMYIMMVTYDASNIMNSIS